ncbi:hypothetical protein DMUE_3228 [Dictyocoela muelleri]|nr:hypothetical protein DMUE_3228 [Dictyocoela muelleri]
MFLYFIRIVCNIEIIHLPRGSVKHSQQVKTIYKIINQEFNEEYKENSDIIHNSSYFNIFILKMNQKSIGSVFLRKNEYVGLKENKKIKSPVIEIYSLVIDQNYRKKGFAQKLLTESLRKFLKINNLNHKTTLIALHLNPDDPMMNISYGFYMSLNFKHADYTTHGPPDNNLNLERIFNMPSPLELLNNFNISKSKGRFVAMYIFFEDFKKIKIENIHEIFEKAQFLREFLKTKV